jgi:putative ABC transport system permease protein
VVYSSPVLETHDRISRGNGVVKDAVILGVAPQYRQVRNLILVAGRFFDDGDEIAHIKCAVVAVPFAQEMYGSSDAAIGQNFQISGIPFTIVGVFKESVDTFGQSEITDNTILIPYSVGRYFTGSDNVRQIYFSIRTMDEVPDASREILRIVGSRHKADSVYKTQDLRELLTMAAKIADILTIVLVLVAAVTLAVGGHYEYHVGQRARTYSRDWHPQGAGGHLS